jgi:hypothetical protein
LTMQNWFISDCNNCLLITLLGKKYGLLLVSKFGVQFHPAVAFVMTGMQKGRLAPPDGSKRFRKG